MVWRELEAVYNLLEDEMSKKIFEFKSKWYFQGGEDETIDYLYNYFEKSRIFGLEKYEEDTSFVICGAGKFGRNTLKALKHAGYKVKCFLDNDRSKSGSYIEDIKVLSFVEFASNEELNKNTVVILDNCRLSEVFFAELCSLGYPQDRIYRTSDNVVRTAFGEIYFDLFKANGKDEVFIDAGSYNGETTRDFIKWCNGEYKKIYAIEPMQDGYYMTSSELKNIPNVELCRCALSNCYGEANFAQSYQGLMGARLGENGDYVEKVKIDTIDNIVSDEYVTFIKMDIEGAELEALKGAENVLRKCKPKLAISLYHKNEDLYQIPIWLSKVVPEYKFYLRHYSNKRWDLVLYCEAK